MNAQNERTLFDLLPDAKPPAAVQPAAIVFIGRCGHHWPVSFVQFHDDASRECPICGKRKRIAEKS